MPARLPFSESSALASSTSWWTSRLVCSDSALTSSAADASCRSDICSLLVRWGARLVGRERAARDRRQAEQPVTAPLARLRAGLREFNLLPAADREDRVALRDHALLDALLDRAVLQLLLGA